MHSQARVQETSTIYQLLGSTPQTFWENVKIKVHDLNIDNIATIVAHFFPKEELPGLLKVDNADLFDSKISFILYQILENNPELLKKITNQQLFLVTIRAASISTPQKFQAWLEPSVKNRVLQHIRFLLDLFKAKKASQNDLKQLYMLFSEKLMYSTFSLDSDTTVGLLQEARNEVDIGPLNILTKAISDELLWLSILPRITNLLNADKFLAKKCFENRIGILFSNNQMSSKQLVSLGESIYCGHSTLTQQYIGVKLNLESEMIFFSCLEKQFLIKLAISLDAQEKYPEMIMHSVAKWMILHPAARDGLRQHVLTDKFINKFRMSLITTFIMQLNNKSLPVKYKEPAQLLIMFKMISLFSDSEYARNLRFINVHSAGFFAMTEKDLFTVAAMELVEKNYPHFFDVLVYMNKLPMAFSKEIYCAVKSSPNNVSFKEFKNDFNSIMNAPWIEFKQKLKTIFQKIGVQEGSELYMKVVAAKINDQFRGLYLDDTNDILILPIINCIDKAFRGIEKGKLSAKRFIDICQDRWERLHANMADPEKAKQILGEILKELKEINITSDALTLFGNKKKEKADHKDKYACVLRKTF